MRAYVIGAALLGIMMGGAVGLYATLAEAQGGIVIVQQGIAFKPATVRVKVGGQVLFRNEDPFGHNVYSPSKGGIFDIGLQAPDSETAVSFKEAGEYIVQCRIHPKMRAVVTVTP
ncbi:plastocyanin/azurin family copper-binding protein [Ferrovibrio terrae]|jgi:plastocyanin|uniref:cupredoxin domain-containing protein n=1 Tax=Ferrovibrio terrae TaxID=2594003 RepID=UPI003138252C